MIYGYARVSTQQQNLELQLDSLKKYGCDKIYAEKITGDSRKKKGRQQLDELLSVIKKGDTLVVWKLDRLSRTLLQTITILDDFLKRGIIFVSISDNFDTTSAYGKAFLNIAAVFAQLEVDLNSERTIEGLEAAKKRGRFGGRPRIPKSTQAKMYRMYYCGNYSISEICQLCHITKPTLYNYLNLYNEYPELAPEIPQELLGYEIHQVGRPKTHQELITKIKTMYEKNTSVAIISEVTGVSKTTIHKYIKQLKLDQTKQKKE